MCSTEKGDGVKVRFAMLISICLGLFVFWAGTGSGGQVPTMDRLTPTKSHVVTPVTTTTQIAPTTTTTSTVPPSVPTTVPPCNTFSCIPDAWKPTAICEEGGRDDPNDGYFGIQEWHHFDGYPTAGSAPLQTQLDWEAYVGQDYPPDAPGECHGY